MRFALFSPAAVKKMRLNTHQYFIEIFPLDLSEKTAPVHFMHKSPLPNAKQKSARFGITRAPLYLLMS